VEGGYICVHGGIVLGKSKREDEALRSLVWDRHERGLSNRQIAKETGVCRNRVNELVKLGPPEEFKRVRAPSRAVAEKPLSEYELLAEIERRLPAEVKAKEDAFKRFMERLEKRRNWDLPFPPEFYGE